jgi:hypothetical protein
MQGRFRGYAVSLRVASDLQIDSRPREGNVPTVPLVPLSFAYLAYPHYLYARLHLHLHLRQDSCLHLHMHLRLRCKSINQSAGALPYAIATVS